jgi:lysophospholipase L1-like esterase
LPAQAGAAPGTTLDFVRAIDLRGTLEANFDPPTAGWHDDLHPTAAGCALLAERVAAALVQG